MIFSPHSRSKTRNPNVALLLQPMLHNFSALALATHLDGMTYRQNPQISRKLFIALLLPHVVAVSPLLHYSYKKMGGEGVHMLTTSHSPLATAPITPCVIYHLQRIRKTPQNLPNVSYHLQTLIPVSTCVAYHLQKRWGGGRRAVCVPMYFIGRGVVQIKKGGLI